MWWCYERWLSQWSSPPLMRGGSRTRSALSGDHIAGPAARMPAVTTTLTRQPRAVAASTHLPSTSTIASKPASQQASTSTRAPPPSPPATTAKPPNQVFRPRTADTRVLFGRPEAESHEAHLLPRASWRLGRLNSCSRNTRNMNRNA